MIISSSVIGALVLAVILTFLAPIIILIVLNKKNIISPKPMWFGVLAFFISQICLRIPILSVLAKQNWYVTFAQQDRTAYILLAAFTAGLFEETARFIGARFCLKPSERRYRDAVAFGLGHGFCECVLLVGLAAEVTNLVNCLLLNSGAVNLSNPTGAQLAAVLTKQLSVPAILMAIWERVGTVIFHLSATIFVFRGVQEKKIGWYFVALAAHTVVDSVPTLIAGSNMLLNDSIIFAISLVLLVFAVRMKPKFEEVRPLAA